MCSISYYLSNVFTVSRPLFTLMGPNVCGALCERDPVFT